MTREEAIDVLSRDIVVLTRDADKWEEARKMAIKALKQEPCEDCISRKDTIDWLKQVTVTDGITFETGFKQILHDIEQMPSVKQKPKADSDCISRQAVLDLMEHYNLYSANLMKDIVSDMPSVNVEPKKGHCKDCKYYHTAWDGTETHYYEDYWCEWVEPNENDFCSLYEAKKEVEQ